MKAIPGFRARNAKGFTLIELMTAVLVASILLAIAIPSYTQQTRKSRRTEAKTALLDLASREERFNSTNTGYTDAPGNLGYAGAFPIAVGSNYYTIQVCVSATLPCTADAGTGAAYLLTATPVTGRGQDKDTQCGSFTLDSTGLQNVTGSASGSPSTCWN